MLVASSSTFRLSPAANSKVLFVLLSAAVLSPALTFRVCIALVALAVALAASLILVFISSFKSTVYFVMLPVSEDDVTVTKPSVTPSTFAPLALIFSLSLPLVLSTSIPAMFVPAMILSFKKVGSIAFLASSCAIVSACFLFTASLSPVPAAMFVIFALPKLNELSVPPEIVAPPIFTLSLNSAEVRPVRALASLIFSVSPLASTPMLLVLRLVAVAPPLIFSSWFA